MFARILMLFVFSLALCSCENMKTKKKDGSQVEPGITDQSGDVNFQSFIGRLRKAVAAHDVPTIASMMTPTFGFRMEPPGEGEGVFQYWDENALWPELELILKEKFVPSGNFMVAPPQFASDPQYRGYRAGMAQINGTWKFAYFVRD
jgi:hypothetical protein